MSRMEEHDRRNQAPKPTIRIGIVGKYVELHDAYMSVREALYHAGNANNRNVEIEWIHSGDLEKGQGLGAV